MRSAAHGHAWCTRLLRLRGRMRSCGPAGGDPAATFLPREEERGGLGEGKLSPTGSEGLAGGAALEGTEASASRGRDRRGPPGSRERRGGESRRHSHKGILIAVQQHTPRHVYSEGSPIVFKGLYPQERLGGWDEALCSLSNCPVQSPIQRTNPIHVYSEVTPKCVH